MNVRTVSIMILIFFTLVCILFYISQQKQPMAERLVRSKTPVGAIGDSTQTKWDEEDLQSSEFK
jgi:hypothetical protein